MSKGADKTTRGFFGHPLGLLNLFSTEFCERFSYYGMRAILVYYLYDATANGGLGLAETDAMIIMSLFGSLVYLTSIIGGWLADRLLGPYRSILYGGATIAAGHMVLGLPLGMGGTVVALGLIVLGTGLLKPNVSVMVGELYARDDPRRAAGFSLLYMSINIGGFISPLIVGGVSRASGYHVAFLIPAVFMALGLFVYIALSKRTLAGIGREVIEPLSMAEKQRWAWITVAGVVLLAAVLGGAQLLGVLSVQRLGDAIPVLCGGIAVVLFIVIFRDRQLTSDERSRMLAYIPLFLAATCFFAMSEQQSSTLAMVADKFVDKNLGGFEIPAAWYASINPLVIIFVSPIFAALWTRLGNRQPSLMVKVAVGLAIASGGFVILALGFFAAGPNPDISPLLLLAAYVFITLGELLLSPTGLAATTQLAPRVHLSKMMGLWFIATAMGQAVNAIAVQRFDASAPAGFYLAYALVALAVAALILIFRRRLLAWARGVR
ncbi:MAG: oligopeptide:H+ symporter [Coriobacteriales bacterium]|jgi:POT family proton-dependent oligopeptide transporter|nr:oligopeptide:H+ symporter [Coriobacteriales bacterium]